MNPLSRVDYHRLARVTSHLDADARAAVNDPAVRHRLMRALCAGFRADAAAVLAELVDEPAAVLEALPESWWFDADQLQVVLTGFTPFLDNADNPSWAVAQQACPAIAEAYACRCELVEVTYAAAEGFAEQVGWHDGQRLVVHCGLAARADTLAVERFAHNCRGALGDESGRAGWPDWVVPDAPAAMETLVDTAAMVDLYARAQDVPAARASRDPGDYVCNAIYYHSLRAVGAARQAERAAEALFVHVPPMEPARAPGVGVALGQAVRAYLGIRLPHP